MTTLIFIIGYLTMVFNEGFVILRHLSKTMAKARQNLIKKYGKKWKIFQQKNNKARKTLREHSKRYNVAKFKQQIS